MAGSRLEKAAGQAESAKAARRKERDRINAMEPAEREKFLEQKYGKTLEQETRILIWDYEMKSLPVFKHKMLVETLEQYLSSTEPRSADLIAKAEKVLAAVKDG